MKILLSLFIISFVFVSWVHALTPAELVQSIEQNKVRVVEFGKLAEFGKANNLRIWIAGGSAAGFAHYVKNQIENEELKKGGKPPLYFEERFGYRYFDIYRMTQDCDVVIDGDESQAQTLESFIKNEFSYLQGEKEVFEVRLLNKSRGSGAGEKESLLNNPNFSNQHTDSHSTGMIELTQPPTTESVLRDLFDWDNQKNSKFLMDVVDNQLSYYFSNKHNTTKRFKQGINPPIISVLRYYTKLFQYGLKPRPEDEKFLLKVIQQFDPNDSRWKESYVNKQINKNGVKMIRHAQDMEFAFDTIERMGLRKKLLVFKGSGQELVSFWVGKEPLRSYPLGRGKGETAAELGIDIVSHETSDLLAYESITKSRRGVPNVFISRIGVDGEAASDGNGFYTKKGMEGARGTGLTIHYKVNPQAVLGVDFIFDKSKDSVIFINRNALTTIDDSVGMSVVKFFKLMADHEMSKPEKGMIMMNAYRFQSQLKDLSTKDANEIYSIVKAEVEKEKPNWQLLQVWFSTLNSTEYPDLIKYITLQRPDQSKEVVEFVLGSPHIARMDLTSGIVEEMFKNAYLREIPMYAEDFGNLMMEYYFSQIDIINRSSTFDYAQRLANGKSGLAVVEHYLTKPVVWDNPEVIKLIKSMISYRSYGSYGHFRAIAYNVLRMPELANHPQGKHLISFALDTSVEEFGDVMVRNILTNPQWVKIDEAQSWLETIISTTKHFDKSIDQYLLVLKEWNKNSRLLKLAGGNPIDASAIRRGLEKEFENRRDHCSGMMSSGI